MPNDTRHDYMHVVCTQFLRRNQFEQPYHCFEDAKTQWKQLCEHLKSSDAARGAFVRALLPEYVDGHDISVIDPTKIQGEGNNITTAIPWADKTLPALKLRVALQETNIITRDFVYLYVYPVVEVQGRGGCLVDLVFFSD